ncbi:MAG: ABC transporter substrate-binding protein [Acidimicrobiia bacterium]
MNRSTRRHSRAIGAIGVLLAFTGLAAACGDDGGDSASTTAEGASTTAAGAATTEAAGATTTEAAAATTVAAPTGEPIKIGLATALTGTSASSYSPYSGNVASAWESWVNTELGGIAGRPVKVIVEDTAAQSAQAQAAAKKLVEQDKVSAIIILDTTSETAMADYLETAKVPVIGGSTNAAAIWLGKPNYFMITSTNPVTAASGVFAAAANGAKNYGAAVCAEVPACAEGGKLYGAVAPQIPTPIAYGGLVTAAATAPNYTAECLKLIELKVDWVQISMSVAPGLRLAADCQKQGFTGTFGASSATVQADKFEAVKGVNFGGSIASFPWWSEAAPVKQFRTVMDTYKKGEEYRSQAGTAAWTALELFRKTMAKAGATTTPADVTAAYQTIKNETLDGLLASPVTFTAGTNSPALSCFWAFSMKDGKFATVSSGTPGNGQTGDLASSCFMPKLG